MAIWGWIYACGVTILPHLPLVAALFLAGLAGSVTHCTVMCSGFVLSQTAALPAKPATAHLLLPYHLGRMTTYAALGALAGLSFHLIAAWPPFVVLRHLMLAVVAVLFLAIFAERFLRKFNLSLPVLPAFRPACAASAMTRVARAHSAVARFGLGLSLGLLPCPLLFGALLAVAARADPLVGAVGMAAFALGTTPALMGIGVAGRNLLNSHPRLQDGLTLTALGINGVVLLALAVS